MASVETTPDGLFKSIFIYILLGTAGFAIGAAVLVFTSVLS
jgi:hypothetical protein